MGILSIILGFIIGAAVLGGFISGLIDNINSFKSSGVCLIPFLFGFCIFGLGIGYIVGGVIGVFVFAIIFRK